MVFVNKLLKIAVKMVRTGNVGELKMGVCRLFFIITMLIIGSKQTNAEMVSDEYVKCISSAQGIHIDLLLCIQEETDRSDKLLNQIYTQLMTVLPMTRKRQLKHAQLLWIAYRDANCEFYADIDGGHEAQLLSAECMMVETESRVHELSGIFAKTGRS
jgi:uncharacterized protein YecT (DUF1311 family)